MNSFTGTIMMLLFIILFKLAITLFDKLSTFKDNKLKFTINVKKESINKMSNLEFEGFCKWLFEGNTEYSNVEFSPFNNESNVSLILTSYDERKTFVDCTKTNIDESTCQKLAGAMVAYNINNGLIVSTGTISDNVLTYINTLRESSSLDIKILTMFDILAILDNRIENNDYSIDVIL